MKKDSDMVAECLEEMTPEGKKEFNELLYLLKAKVDSKFVNQNPGSARKSNFGTLAAMETIGALMRNGFLK